MTSVIHWRRWTCAAVLLACATASAGPAYQQTNLVSDGSTTAAFTDPNLKNPWGLAQGPGPFWIANQMTNTSTLYDATGAPQPAGSPLVVSVPQTKAVPQGPTGIAYNGTGDFNITKGQSTSPALFVFVGLDGSISGWSPSVDTNNAITAIDNHANAIYTGLT